MNFADVYSIDTQSSLGYSEALVGGITNPLPPAEDLKTAFSHILEDTHVNPRAKFQIVVEGKQQILHPWVKEHAYQIGREALMNAFRHSGASNVELYLLYTTSELHLAVEDNGRGISVERLQAGCSGLSWMRRLAEQIGAKFRLLSRAGVGTEVLLSMPSHTAFVPKQTREAA